MEEKEVDKREELFLEYLFADEFGGNAHKAKVAAGYSYNYPTRELVSRLQDKIIEETRKFFAQNAPKAALKITSVLDNPANVGNKELLAAAKDLLDRAGVSKPEQLEIKSGNSIIILPPKEVEIGEEI